MRQHMSSPQSKRNTATAPAAGTIAAVPLLQSLSTQTQQLAAALQAERRVDSRAVQDRALLCPLYPADRITALLNMADRHDQQAARCRALAAAIAREFNPARMIAGGPRLS